MKRIKLSENFYLDEFTRSQTAARLGQVIEVEPGSEVFGNLQHLCETVLQPVRDALGVAVHITSGYRPEWLNLAVRGSDTSAHVKGLAADFVVGGMTPLEVCRQIVAIPEPVPFAQLIYEFGVWVHISAPALDDEPARDALTAYRDLVTGKLKTLYANGLHPVETLTNGGR